MSPEHISPAPIDNSMVFSSSIAELPHLSDFVSASTVMNTFMKVVRRVALSDSPLLILGETGVGKERLAKAMHLESARAKNPFIGVNCGALPENLLESELFGHEKGAFTGAVRARRGWIELAHTGTIFFDEIGEMPLHLQVKLLRVLQEREVQRVGSEKTVKVDVRIVAATNKDLETETQKGNFRKDLFYRLSVVSLTLPPLRERQQDIPALVNSYIQYFAPRLKSKVTSIQAAALEALMHYKWPGNVRELMNIIERAVLLCEGAEITLQDLPESISRNVLNEPNLDNKITLAHVSDGWLHKPLRQVRDEVIETVEREYLSRLLELTKGRIGEAAKRAGLDPRSLYEKMRYYDLKKERFKLTVRRAARTEPSLY